MVLVLPWFWLDYAIYYIRLSDTDTMEAAPPTRQLASGGIGSSNTIQIHPRLIAPCVLTIFQVTNVASKYNKGISIINNSRKGEGEGSAKN